VSTNPTLFDAELKAQIVKGLAVNGDAGRTWSGVVASLARGQSASKVGEMINESRVVEAITGQTAELDDCEAVEGALVVCLP
jgi:hypothetical protein